MGENHNSWLRRTKFSHTVCHRLNPSTLAFIPLSNETEHNSGLKSRPSRSSSPLPEILLSDTFREARHDQKRFSTPGPRRNLSNKGNMGKLQCNELGENKVLRLKLHSNRPNRQVKPDNNSNHQKDLAWTKCLNSSGGGSSTPEEIHEQWDVDLSKLFLGLKFAHGAHSRLYHGVYKEESVAVKMIRVPDDDDENGTLASKLENQFTREATFLSHLYHPNIIKLVAACKKPPVYCIITEYLSEGSLRSYLHKLERKPMSLDKLIAFALDIARGMEYIHSQGVIHRDLKPENVLINEDSHLKIADFGIACEEAVCDLLADDPGTYRWMAPEMIKRKSYGKKVDVYSFGLILWEMLTGTIPYEEMTPIQAAFAVVNKVCSL
ncbi:hypothetical protein PIB30_035114 [Stylosanthes scabra]|uniref:Protein kinase domain-containing protein n=1 Tax=Stylosanthes scabra TaxID=79078 RepID=A0ABU6SDA4_9FABA|nr:hypothetical protein [Stylosanthes scabra]